MRTLLAMVVGAVLVLGDLPGVAAPYSSGTLVGTVQVTQPGRLVPLSHGVPVHLMKGAVKRWNGRRFAQQQPARHFVTYADSQGRFAFYNVPPGSYEVAATVNTTVTVQKRVLEHNRVYAYPYYKTYTVSEPVRMSWHRYMSVVPGRVASIAFTPLNADPVYQAIVQPGDVTLLK